MKRRRTEFIPPQTIARELGIEIPQESSAEPYLYLLQAIENKQIELPEHIVAALAAGFETKWGRFEIVEEQTVQSMLEAYLATAHQEAK